MKKTINITIFVIVVVIVTTGIIITTIPNNTDSRTEISGQTSELYEIPIHVYEIWDSQGIIIHGNVDVQNEDNSPVEIQISNEGGIIDTAKIIPDDSGRFIHGVTKFIPYLAEIDPKWKDVQSYDVVAFYPYPVSYEKEENDYISNRAALDKNKIPLTAEQISNLSHQQIINTIEEWNKVGGVVPFTLLTTVGVEKTYDLGQPMPFLIQKSGYGNPCHNQGVVIFNENTKEVVRSNLYLEFCNPDKEITEPFNYMIPYNHNNIFPKIPAITEPGEYVMLVRAENDSKYIQKFSIIDSDHTFEHKLVYSMQKESTSNKRALEIDLVTGKMSVESPESREITRTSLDSETLNRLNQEIKNYRFLSNPFTNQVYGELCDTCNLGQIEIYIDDMMVHHIVWDDKSLETRLSETSPDGAEFFSYFDVVDCIAAKNSFDTYWISDSAISEKNYSDSTEICNDLVKDSSGLNSFFPGQNADYDVLVNDKPRRNIPEGAGNLGGIHVHASILVKIFGDKFDFSKSVYQIKSPYIHFEGWDGNTTHMHATKVPLGFLFESMKIGITEECFVFTDSREFCTNSEHHLKFYINGEQVNSIAGHVISQDDRILISYGPEKEEEIQEQVAELESQEIIS